MPGRDELYTSDAKKLFDSSDAELLVLGDGLSIGFCVSSAEGNRLDKTDYLSAFEWISGTLREESSIIAPTITVEHEGFPNWNYAYIPNFNRYYFITDIVSVRGLWRISFRVDPLMSFKEIIKETKAMIGRNEWDFDVRVNDDIFPAIYGKDVEEFDAAEIGDATIEFVPDRTLNLKRHIAVTTIVPFRGNNNSPNPDSPDPGYLPKVVTNNFVGSSCYKTYAMTEDEFLKLSQYILNHDNKGTFLISAINYPYEIPWNRNEEEVPVYLGNSAVINITDPVPEMVLYSHSATLPFWSYAILGSIFTDPGTQFDRFEPYVTQELYVPYSGWCKLPLDVVQGQTGHRIICYYAIDHINGTATAYLYDKTAHRAIWSAPAQIGYKIGINSTNAYENRRTEEANNANLILSSLGAAVSLVAGIVTENPIMAAGGIIGEAKAISSYNITKSGIMDRAQAEMSAGVSGISSYPRLRLRKTRMLSNSYGDQDFNHQYGRPLNQIRKIGNLTGHTVVSSVHLEIPAAYPSEVNEIEALLKEGFIA